MASRYGLQIRAATAADAEGLAELMGAVGVPVLAAAVAERLAAVRDHGCGSVLLAVEWGPPSGVLAFQWYPTLGADMPLAQIDWLAVVPEERRRGIARTLLNRRRRRRVWPAAGHVRSPCRRMATARCGRSAAPPASNKPALASPAPCAR